MRNWILPEHIEDVLPAEAERIEALRRAAPRSLPRRTATGSCSRRWSSTSTRCLTGTGRDLDLQTFKVVDPLSGRLLGRARRHHAAGRAHRRAPAERAGRHAPLLRRQRAAHGGRHRRRRAKSMQIGAELFGEAGIAGDIEVLTLFLSSLAPRAWAACISTSATSASIARSPRAPASPAKARTSELFAALRAKDVPARDRAHGEAARRVARRAHRAALALRTGARGARGRARAAARHAGDPQRARRARGARHAPPRRRSTRCTSISPTCAATITTAARSFRCSPPASPDAIGNGGRYDGIGKAFGRARPATGFTLDLRQLAGILPRTARPG